MRLCVAATAEDIDRAEKFIAAVKDLGHQITVDWTRRDTLTSMSAVHSAAQETRQGVRDCDLFILMWHQSLLGGLIELGMALEQDKPVWIIDDNDSARFSIFFCFESNPVPRLTTDEALTRLSPMQSWNEGPPEPPPTEPDPETDPAPSESEEDPVLNDG